MYIFFLSNIYLHRIIMNITWLKQVYNFLPHLTPLDPPCNFTIDCSHYELLPDAAKSRIGITR